jgi:hypothetical protein
VDFGCFSDKTWLATGSWIVQDLVKKLVDRGTEDSWSKYLSIEGIYKRYEVNASIAPKICEPAVKKKLKGFVRGFRLFGVFSRPSERGFTGRSAAR